VVLLSSVIKKFCGAHEIINVNNNKMSVLNNGLYIVSTPIGNLEDISFRAIDVLKKVDFIVCENPKHSIKLLNKFGIKKKLFSLHDHNEEITIKKLEKYKHNKSIALISDAGSPLISDPGYKLVRDFINNDIFITVIPGASSIISSLQLSGLPINNFIFFGFVSKNNSASLSIIKKFTEIKETGLFLVSGSRLRKFLNNMILYSDKIEVTICKELTKINETIVRGNVSELIKKIDGGELNLKGEFTIIASINHKKNQSKTIDDDIKKQIFKLLKKYSLTETVQIVHKLTNISKKIIYEETLKIKNV
tara:strand:- start:939 stop:1856 length:918 start_codon:yes stop_codon:yes gene_type:complete